MKYTSNELWNNFLNSLKKNLETSTVEILNKFDSYNQRKIIWKYDLLPQMADQLNLLYDDSQEFLRIDYTLFQVGSEYKWKVPQICIESENNWDSSYEEILKLCSINCPLKILILYGISDNINLELKNNESHWDYILKDFQVENGLVGYFGVIIYLGQDDNTIKFKKLLYNSLCEQIENEVISINTMKTN